MVILMKAVMSDIAVTIAMYLMVHQGEHVRMEHGLEKNLHVVNKLVTICINF